MSYSIHVQITDPWASPNEVAHEYKRSLTKQVGSGYDAIVLAVGHEEYKNLGMNYFRSIAQGELILFDLKGIYQGQREVVDFLLEFAGKKCDSLRIMCYVCGSYCCLP